MGPIRKAVSQLSHTTDRSNQTKQIKDLISRFDTQLDPIIKQLDLLRDLAPPDYGTLTHRMHTKRKHSKNVAEVMTKLNYTDDKKQTGCHVYALFTGKGNNSDTVTLNFELRERPRNVNITSHECEYFEKKSKRLRKNTLH